MNADPGFNGLLALLLILLGASGGIAAVALFDYVHARGLHRSRLDRCGDCHRVLRLRPSTGDYAPHRCAPHR